MLKKTKKKGGMSPAERIKRNRAKYQQEIPVYEDNNFRVGIEIEVCTFQALNSLTFIDIILDKIKEFKKTNSLQEKGKILSKLYSAERNKAFDLLSNNNLHHSRFKMNTKNRVPFEISLTKYFIRNEFLKFKNNELFDEGTHIKRRIKRVKSGRDKKLITNGERGEKMQYISSGLNSESESQNEIKVNEYNLDENYNKIVKELENDYNEIADLIQVPKWILSLKYFICKDDISIKCDEKNLRLEFILIDKYAFQFWKYMDNIMDEIKIIMHNSKPCNENSCALHIHYSYKNFSVTDNALFGDYFLYFFNNIFRVYGDNMINKFKLMTDDIYSLDYFPKKFTIAPENNWDIYRNEDFSYRNRLINFTNSFNKIDEWHLENRGMVQIYDSYSKLDKKWEELLFNEKELHINNTIEHFKFYIIQNLECFKFAKNIYLRNKRHSDLINFLRIHPEILSCNPLYINLSILNTAVAYDITQKYIDYLINNFNYDIIKGLIWYNGGDPLPKENEENIILFLKRVPDNIWDIKLKKAINRFFPSSISARIISIK